MPSIDNILLCLALLALRDLRLRLGLDPIAGDGYCAVEGIYEGVEA